MRFRVLAAAAILILAVPPVEADDPTTVTQFQYGMLACSAAWSPPIPPEPLPPVPPPVQVIPRASGTNPCGFEDQVGVTNIDRFNLTWPIAGDLANWTDLDVTMNWTPSTAASVRLTLNAYVWGCDNLAPYFLGRVDGPSPLTLTANSTTLQSVLSQGAGGGCAAAADCDLDFCRVHTRVFASPTLVSAGPAGAGVALFQIFDQTLEATFE